MAARWRRSGCINRPQVNGSLSFLKTGWGGSHTFRIGGEYMSDQVVAPIYGYGNACNCVSTLNNGVPTQVQILLGANVSKNDLTTSAGFVDDTWRLDAARSRCRSGCAWIATSRACPAQEGPARADVRGDRSRPHVQQLGPRASA